MNDFTEDSVETLVGDSDRPAPRRPLYFVVSDERLSVVENVVSGLEILKEHGRRHRGRHAVLESEDGVLLASFSAPNLFVPGEEA